MKKLNELQSYLTRLRGLMLTLIILCSIGSGNVWAQTTTTYTFSSKAWAASPANWTSGKDGNALTSGQGIQVTTGTSGANGTSPKSFTNVSKVVVTYSTNSSKGAGSIAVQIGSNTASSQNVTKTGGTTDRTLTYNFSPNQTGKVKVTVTCTTNSIYVKSVAITEAAAASCTTNPTVTAASNSSVTATTATVSCSSGISSLGSAGCSITDYGFVIGTSSNPAIGGSGVTKHQVGTTYTSTGASFSKDLTGLSAETTYYVRPYATNGNGTAYGTQTSFTTSALPKYTVTLKDNDETLTQANAGATVTLPTRTGCTGYTFAGWTKSWAAAQTTWTTTAPTIIPAGSYTPTANENLYPVYTKTEGGGMVFDEYEKCTTAPDDWTAYKYIYATADDGYALAGKASGGNYGDYASFSTTTEMADYELTLEEGSTGNYKVKQGGKYISCSSFGNLYWVDTYTAKTSSVNNGDWQLYKPTGTAYRIESPVKNSNNKWIYIDYNSSSPRFNSYVSGGQTAAYLYKRKEKSGSTTYYISVPGCCTNWSTPTVSYSSSLAINASEAVTISSGTTHGAVTYESSDEDVLTVDADGTIHAVGAGTAHIIATWAGDATYCEKSANSNDVTVSGIQVTGTTPVNFGQVYQNAAVANKTIYVTGLGLASPITPSLPVGSPFSFSPASLAKDCSGATLTISASTATLGTYNQTLTLTSGAFSATVTVKMEVIAKPTATFTDALHELTTDKNGASLNSFNLEAAQGTPVVFPTLANQTKSAGTCEGEYYIFAGWTEGDNNTDPQDHLVTSHTLANGDAKHYYAVWADASGSVTYTKLTSNSFSTSAHYVIGAESGGTDYFLYSCEKTDANNSWGLVSSDPATDAPIQFTLSGTASALVAASTEATTRYLKAASGKQFFGMSSSSTTVVLGSGGTIESTADTYNNLRYNSAGGLRWYTGTTTGDAVYFYEVGSSGTVHYRTSCCANKVDAPVVTATTVTSTSITLTWPADVKATGWEVSWNGGAFGAPSGTCTHTVSGLTPNTTYTWKVRATYNAPQCGADTRSGSTTTHQVYHVTYAKGSGTGSCTASGSTTDETGYEAGATVTLQANEFLLSGHTFAGWTEDDEDITISSNQFTMPDHDVVITASWTAKVDKYFDRMHDQTDASHGGVAETEGTNEGKYYILKEGCSYSVPTAVDSKTGDACQTSHYKLRGWIAASYVNSKGEITDESKIFSPGTTKTAGGYTYYAVWAEVVE